MEHFYLYAIVWYLLGIIGTSYMLYHDYKEGYDIRVEQLLIGAFLSIFGAIQILIILIGFVIDHINIRAILDRTVIKGKTDD
jgi:hypothetical protein